MRKTTFAFFLFVGVFLLYLTIFLEQQFLAVSICP